MRSGVKRFTWNILSFQPPKLTRQWGRSSTAGRNLAALAGMLAHPAAYLGLSALSVPLGQRHISYINSASGTGRGIGGVRSDLNRFGTFRAGHRFSTVDRLIPRKQFFSA